MITNIDPSFSANVAKHLRDVPYDITRTRLYTVDDLYAGIVNGPMAYHDAQVYAYFLETGKVANSPAEQAARTMHDYAICQAMKAFLALYEPKKTVGVMGGHQLLRTDPMYAQIVRLAKTLTEQGFLMVTGGGPGAMEATHVGAWMAGRTDDELAEALSMLEQHPHFSDPRWLMSALDVIRLFPQEKMPYSDRLRYRHESLAIPTWLYGHEPSTPFATHIAKLFDNSIREDSIITVSYGGIIYTPGSAGTLQEIFQDAVQNHYQSLGFASPMIFLGTDFWTKEVPVYPMMQDMLSRGRYQHLLLTLTDSNADIVTTLQAFAGK